MSLQTKRVKAGEKLDADTINALVAPLYAAVADLQQVRISWQEQVSLFNTNALRRVSEAATPLLNQISGAINGGLLVADTTDTIGFAQGDDIDLLIASASRVTFQPTPFVMLTHPSAAADWALCRVTNYVQTTGVISLEVLTLHGSGAERTGWVISASAGLTDAILNAAFSAAASAASALQAAEDTGAAAILIAGGPVSSVNSRNGAVTGLAEAADVAIALAGKAGAAATESALADKADALAVATALNSKADAVTTYTKTAADALLAAKANSVDAGFVSQFKYAGITS